MDLKLVVLLLTFAAALTEARPRYIAIPVEDLRLMRQMRSMPAYPQFQHRMLEDAVPSKLEVSGSDLPDSYHRQPYALESPDMSESRQPESYYPAEDEGNNIVLVPDSSDIYERQAPHGSGGYGGGNDLVDYGAYTGGYGAFGWYTDHPVCINCHGGYGHSSGGSGYGH